MARRRGEVAQLVEVRDVLEHCVEEDAGDFPDLTLEPKIILPRNNFYNTVDEMVSCYEAVYPYSLHPTNDVMLSYNSGERRLRLTAGTLWFEVSSSIPILAANSDQGDFVWSCSLPTLRARLRGESTSDTVVLSRAGAARMAVNESLLLAKQNIIPVQPPRPKVDKWRKITIYSFIARQKRNGVLLGVDGAALIRLLNQLHQQSYHHILVYEGERECLVFKTNAKEEEGRVLEYRMAKNIVDGGLT